VPHVGVVASDDVEDMMREKGLEGGFLELIRPYGERVQGKITIRDSIGASRSWDDYGVRFTGLKDGLRPPRESLDQNRVRKSMDARPGTGTATPDRTSFACARTGGDTAQIEEAVEKHLDFAEFQSGNEDADYLNRRETRDEARPTSPFYLLYLRRLLSGMPMSPHESFSHPVACVIAISSRNPKPIEELRRLYGSTYSGDLKLPQWVDNEYLRYYVLVHDEDDGDIQRSTALFDNMKRHFGLHCHLLRLRSGQCVSSDDDSVRLPMCEWISATEELDEIRKRGMIMLPGIYLEAC
jgi:trafficking protein particle complex subunit 8